MLSYLLLSLTNLDNEDFIPTYTDIKELKMVRNESVNILHKEMSIYECAKFARDITMAKGIVINSHNDNLILNRNNIDYILSHPTLDKPRDKVTDISEAYMVSVIDDKGYERYALLLMVMIKIIKTL